MLVSLFSSWQGNVAGIMGIEIDHYYRTILGDKRRAVSSGLKMAWFKILSPPHLSPALSNLMVIRKFDATTRFNFTWLI